MFNSKLKDTKIIPVVVIEDVGHALPLATAVASGGLRCIEITMRTGVAVSAMRAMADSGKLLVGAGTVLNIDQAKAAIDHGAQFIVSPGLSIRLVEWCQQHGIPVYPGCATATELQMAVETGLDTVKFFPAEQLGGTAMLKTLSSVFRTMRFMPTGGINGGNIADYLALHQVVACGGSWMVRPEWLVAGEFAKIRDEISTTLARLPR